jgi:hypothetical protein
MSGKNYDNKNNNKFFDDNNDSNHDKNYNDYNYDYEVNDDGHNNDHNDYRHDTDNSNSNTQIVGYPTQDMFALIIQKVFYSVYSYSNICACIKYKTCYARICI